MKYCSNCRHITPGEALFCGHCGRSYNVKLCPARHSNSREALVCSDCGSRDLSTPAHRLSIGGSLLQSGLRLLPRFLPWLFAVAAALLVLNAILSPDLQGLLFVAVVVLGVAWYVYISLPHFVRSGLRAVVRKLSGREHRAH
jgi:hypothetical protein